MEAGTYCENSPTGFGVTEAEGQSLSVRILLAFAVSINQTQPTVVNALFFQEASVKSD